MAIGKTQLLLFTFLYLLKSKQNSPKKKEIKGIHKKLQLTSDEIKAFYVSLFSNMDTVGLTHCIHYIIHKQL